MRRVLAAAAAALAASAASAAIAAALSPAGATTVDDLCSQLSPSGAPCIGAGKLAERLSAECRRVGRPADDCQMPLGHKVGSDIVEHYRASWLHRTAAFQYRLGNPIAFRDAPWLGTHNSFNTVSDPPTLSKTDSNQQLTLPQQLDSDMRSLELDVHWVSSLDAAGQRAVVVCHGRGPDEQHFGCTNERRLGFELKQIAGWLAQHRTEVVLLYLEDELGDPAGYVETVATLEDVLGRRIYHPSKDDLTANGCADLPLGLSRNAVRAAGAQVVLVGNCRSGWASEVFGWDDVHVESGSTSRYRDYPGCDATYDRDVYAAKLVRYYEDSTFVSAAVDPTATPAEAAAEMLKPAKVAAMTRCGVNLFGLDQLLPDDGRIEASIWSWAKDKPDRADGKCAIQRSDSRWETRTCSAKRRAACLVDGNWHVTGKAYAYPAARAECRRRGGALGLPRTGYDNAALRKAAPGDARDVWIDYRLG
jgi:hypothetical protein